MCGNIWCLKSKFCIYVKLTSQAVDHQLPNMKVVAFSDSMGVNPVNLPDGDVLVCAGNFSRFGDYKEITRWYDWFTQQPHHHKILVYGNHEISTDIFSFKRREPWLVWSCPDEELLTPPPGRGVHLLHATGVTIEGVTFWGHPGIPPAREGIPARQNNFYCAHQFESHDESVVTWAKCPRHVDVLVTHVPPHGILDYQRGRHMGNIELRKEIDQRINPTVHVFGHVRDCPGIAEVGLRRPVFYNVAQRVVTIEIN